MTVCIDCGKKATGDRCRVCRGIYVHRLAATALEPEDRTLLAMRDGEKLSYAAIGRRLGVSPPAVQVRLNRARVRQRIREGVK